MGWNCRRRASKMTATNTTDAAQKTSRTPLDKNLYDVYH
jgi:hypothetical protein